nr:NADH dehydrogenase subunit 6 [Megacampsomeris sp. 1 YJY-2023a]
MILIFLYLFLFIIYFYVFMMPDKHPMILCMYLTLFIIIMLSLKGFYMKSFLYCYMIFFIIIGGMMVIFLYFSSSASLTNKELEKKKIKLMNLYSFIWLMYIIFMMLFLYSMFNYIELDNDLSKLLYKKLLNMFNNNYMYNNLESVYINSYNFFSILSIFFLFMFMLMIVKICKINKMGSMRQKFNK